MPPFPCCQLPALHDEAPLEPLEPVGTAGQRGLLSDEHLTVDGTLIEAWASLKSFKLSLAV